MFRTLYSLFESLLVIKSKCGGLEQDGQDYQDEKAESLPFSYPLYLGPSC